MTIREVEKELGITRANVRFYEKEGLIFPKRNPVNDYRDYSAEDVEILKRILYLRNLEMPIETIRRLQQGKLSVREAMEQQLLHFTAQEERAERSRAVIREILSGREEAFLLFPMPEAEGQIPAPSLRDALGGLWYFREQLVAWGFLLIQLIYTVAVLPMLPEQIPVSWSGVAVTAESSRLTFLRWPLISLLFSYVLRLILYNRLVGGLRCYLDELNAIFTVGGVGFGVSMQVYTVLYLMGIRVNADGFLLGCIAAYLFLVLGIVLISQMKRRRGNEVER